MQRAFRANKPIPESCDPMLLLWILQFDKAKMYFNFGPLLIGPSVHEVAGFKTQLSIKNAHFFHWNSV